MTRLDYARQLCRTVLHEAAGQTVPAQPPKPKSKAATAADLVVKGVRDFPKDQAKIDTDMYTAAGEQMSKYWNSLRGMMRRNPKKLAPKPPAAK